METSLIKSKAKKTRNILIAIGAFMVFGTGFIFAKKRLGSNAENDAKKEIKEKNLSYSNSQYSIYAAQLFQAMEFSGTDEATIYKVFSAMVNKDDVLQLIIAFGTRTIHTFGFGTKHNLATALQDELDSKEIAKVNQILSSKGIDLRF